MNYKMHYKISYKSPSLKKAESLAANQDTNFYINDELILNKSTCLQLLRQGLLTPDQTDQVLEYLGLGEYRQAIIQDIVRKIQKKK